MFKRSFLLPVVVAMFASSASAQVSNVHEKCLKASDYKGCVEVMSGGSSDRASTGSIDSLKSALRLLPNRLENTNLRDFTANTQIFNDAVSGIDPSRIASDYERSLYQEAKSIQSMVAALQAYWSIRISNGTYYGTYGSKSYYCSVLRPALASFNAYAGPYSVAYNGYQTGGGFLNPVIEKCLPQEADMVRAISRRVQEALIDPEVKKAQIEKKKRDEEIAAMEPWKRYLEENPQIKKWAEANPSAAAAEQKKFLEKLRQKPDSAKKSQYNFQNHGKDCAQQPTKDLFVKCMQGL